MKDPFSWKEIQKTSRVNGKVSNLQSYYTTPQEVVPRIKEHSSCVSTSNAITQEDGTNIRNIRKQTSPS